MWLWALGLGVVSVIWRAMMANGVAPLLPARMHPAREALLNELHARPHASLTSPAGTPCDGVSRIPAASGPARPWNAIAGAAFRA